MAESRAASWSKGRLAGLRGALDRSRGLALTRSRSKVGGASVGPAHKTSTNAGKGDVVTDRPTADGADIRCWTPAKTFDDFACVCCGRPHLTLLTDPEAFSLTQRVARLGPITISEFVVGSDVSVDCGEMCETYRVLVPLSGHMDCAHRGSAFSTDPGTAAVFAPLGLGAARWVTGTRTLCLKINRWAVNDALSDALGRQVTSQIDVTPAMPIGAAPSRSWIKMLALFKDQLFRPDGLLNHPLVGMPFAESVVRGFLLAAEHSHRDALVRDQGRIAPRAIRTAIEILEEEAHLPLTLSALATRCHISVRALQEGFRRHVGISPMAYLREVRLRRAHQTLLKSDPSTATVASVAYQWGFTNLGRFAAAHTARYHEPPVKTLHRSA